MKNKKDNLIGKKISFLQILEKYSSTKYVCRCTLCGKKIVKDISSFKDNRKNKSCGCRSTKRDLPSLHNLWKNFNDEEKLNWNNNWESFVLWARKNKYSEILSYHKKNRKFLYNKDNLEFGIFINKEFFSVERLKKNRIEIDDELLQFVVSKRIKDLIVSDTEITRRLTRQINKHKVLPDELFRLLK